MLIKCKDHLSEAESSYFSHLTHSLYQSKRLFIIAIKSCIHGIVPCMFKADAPKMVIRMYNEIKKIKHLKKQLIDEDVRNSDM